MRHMLTFNRYQYRLLRLCSSIMRQKDTRPQQYKTDGSVITAFKTNCPFCFVTGMVLCSNSTSRCRNSNKEYQFRFQILWFQHCTYIVHSLSLIWQKMIILSRTGHTFSLMCMLMIKCTSFTKFCFRSLQRSYSNECLYIHSHIVGCRLLSVDVRLARAHSISTVCANVR